MSAPDLHVERAGDGPPVVLLHGLTASHRYVVMGSRALERAGHHVVAYDARGHGGSDPAPDPADYGYATLAADLGRVLDDEGIERAVLAGASMGAHTLLRYTLDHPERVAGIVVITPAYDARRMAEDDPRYERWDALADGLESGGVEGFVAAYDSEPGGPADPAFRETVLKVVRQRLAEHAHPEAVAAALRVVPRSRPFPDLGALAAVDVPAVVVASRDEADPGHPRAVGEAYAEAIPGARLRIEDEGKSPLAWQGGQLSRVIADLAAQT